MTDVEVSTVNACVVCGRPTKGSSDLGLCQPCSTRSERRLRRVSAWRAKRVAAGLPVPPTKEEIAAACAEIRKTWSPADFAIRAPHLAARRFDADREYRAGILGCVPGASRSTEPAEG
jgi:hypothetical protein